MNDPDINLKKVAINLNSVGRFLKNIFFDFPLTKRTEKSGGNGQ